MKWKIPVIVLLLALIACGGPKVVYDYDDKVDFRQYRTYNIYPELQTGLSMLDEKRLLEAVDAVMQEQGFSKSTSPDLYLNIFSEQFQEPTRNRLGVGISGGSRGLGVGISGGVPVGGPDRYQVLVLDLIDVRVDQLIWQAEVQAKWNASATPEQKRTWFQKAVKKAFSAYPPKD